MKNSNWLIWSIEHNGWWKPAQFGYTQKKDEAGRYSFEQARKIVASANEFRGSKPPNEAMIEDKAMTNIYRCTQCGMDYVRDCDKVFVNSFCEKTGKKGRLTRLFKGK